MACSHFTIYAAEDENGTIVSVSTSARDLREFILDAEANLNQHLKLVSFNNNNQYSKFSRGKLRWWFNGEQNYNTKVLEKTYIPIRPRKE